MNVVHAGRIGQVVLGVSSVGLTPRNGHRKLAVVGYGRIHQYPSTDQGFIDPVAHRHDHTRDVGPLDERKRERHPQPTNHGVWIVGCSVRTATGPEIGVVHGGCRHPNQHFATSGNRTRPVVVELDGIEPAVAHRYRSAHDPGKRT